MLFCQIEVGDPGRSAHCADLDSLGGLSICIDERGQVTLEGNNKKVFVHTEISANTNQLTANNTCDCYAINKVRSMKQQVGACFRCGNKGHFASQCHSRQVVIVIYSDPTSDDVPVDEDAEMEARDYETVLSEEIAERDPKIDTLFIHVVPMEDTKADDGSWK